MVSLCKHTHLVLPPAGSIITPSDCQHCGITWADAQAERRQQEIALIHGTSHDGECPHCKRVRRLYRYQAPTQPWHELGTEPPVTWMCDEDYRTAAQADETIARSVIAGAAPRNRTAA